MSDDFNLFEVPEGTKNVSDDIIEQQNILDQQIRTCFNTRAGRKVMEYLERISVQPGFDAGMGLLNGIANGFAREGQTAMVQHLKSRIKRAEQG